MEDEQFNERQQLMERFRHSLSQPLTERFFDEDELIDIFDDAGDLEDDLIRLEVLSVASRFYPDSEPLNQRRCLFYSQISDTAGAQKLEQYAECKGAMWQLMRIRQNRNRTDSDFPRLLDLFMHKYQKFDDEEVAVQLIRLTAELNLPQWLGDNVNGLIKRCSNERVVLFEAAVAFETMHRYGHSIDLLVRLTDIDPFGYANWLMLAEHYLATDNEEGFNSAIEYAMALEPRDWQCYYVKGKYLLTKGKSLDEAAGLLAQACAFNPPSPEPYRLYAICMNEKGEQQTAINVYRNILFKFPQDVLTIIPELLAFNPADADKLFDEYYRLNPDNSELFWRTWSDRLWELGSDRMALAAVDCFYRQTGVRVLNLIKAENEFRHNTDPDTTLELLQAYETGRREAGEPVDYGSYYMMLVITLARAGRFRDASLKCVEFFTMFNNFVVVPLSRDLALKQAVRVLRNVAQMLGKDAKPEYFSDLSKFYI